MTREELTRYLASHPDMKICPNCGGAGELIFPGGVQSGTVIECGVCQGAGVVRKEIASVKEYDGNR
jgi:DnaJ-class molecular chaperone